MRWFKTLRQAAFNAMEFGRFATRRKNVSTAKDAPEGAGDVWTWTAIDADTKLIVSYLIGGRDAECAMEFMDNLKARLSNRVQLTTDGHKTYLETVEGAFGGDQLIKIYGASPTGPQDFGNRLWSPCLFRVRRLFQGKRDDIVTLR